MYLPLRGSQTTIWLFGSKHLRPLLIYGRGEDTGSLLQSQILSLEALVAALCRGDDRRVADERVVNSWVRN